ncbi:MAG: hypothetical protein II551_06470 [Paludibacteraceae bacterium]|nr:hypothetical protein [Paludibacteraceae bacterium]
MSTKKSDIDLNEVAISLDVDNDFIEGVRNGNVTHISISINEQRNVGYYATKESSYLENHRAY